MRQTHRLVGNAAVVEKDEAGQKGHDVRLVLRLLRQRVAGEVEALELWQLPQVDDGRLLQRLQLVLSHRQHLQLLERVEALQPRNAVVVQREVPQLGELFQPLDFVDVVEAQVW